MKKLMVAFVAVAMAFAAQANAIKWGASLVSPSTGTVGNTSYTSYLFVTSDTSGTLASYYANLADVTSSLSSGDLSVLEKAIGSANASSVLTTGSNAGKMSWATSTADKEALVGSTVSAFLIFVDDAEKNYLVAQNAGSDVMSKTVGSGTGAYTFAFNSQAANTHAWAEIAPEPTSGLMMLLGMGVLALRRRRA